MKEIRKGFEKGLSEEDVELYVKVNMTARQWKKLEICLKEIKIMSIFENI
ncbi:hypothetical protein JMUB3870_1346 [Leptotrichia trevisanii]|uniref:Uncharacterized protein n=2 Tax=Leptotrichia trevisanii TaxID=109328 RepID=A0A510K0R2_9FUSO|nr:hypothetical protein JMUB3870_1346 [Leptotrichia trevisanii]